MNKNTLKIVAGILVVADLVLLFISEIGGGVGGLFGLIMGWGIMIILFQKLFQWVLNKSNVAQADVIGLIIALIFYATVFSFFTFVA